MMWLAPERVRFGRVDIPVSGRYQWGELMTSNSMINPLLYLFSMVLFIFGAMPAQSDGQESLPNAVTIRITDQRGPLLVTQDGSPLYTWAVDNVANESRCNNERYSSISGAGENPAYLPDAETRPTCEQAWPPFTATATDQPTGNWTIFERHDGTRQWAYLGKPVYTSMYDRTAGHISGLDGAFFSRTPLFHRLAAPMGMAGRLTSEGYLLTTADGFTLYTPVSRQPQEGSACCQQSQPYLAPALAEFDSGPWSVEPLGDGRRQWYRDGQPLYTFKRDRQPGDVNGGEEDGLAPVILYKPLQPPDDITTQMTSEGLVFADKQGKTLYIWSCNDESPDNLPCDAAGASQVYRLSICGAPEKCMATWRPVLASEGARPIGSTWTIIAIDPSGKNQYVPTNPAIEPLMVWAYNGKPVYTYAGDKEPGDIVGHGVRSIGLWGFFMLMVDLSQKPIT